MIMFLKAKIYNEQSRFNFSNYTNKLVQKIILSQIAPKHNKKSKIFQSFKSEYKFVKIKINLN